MKNLNNNNNNHKKKIMICIFDYITLKFFTEEDEILKINIIINKSYLNQQSG